MMYIIDCEHPSHLDPVSLDKSLAMSLVLGWFVYFTPTALNSWRLASSIPGKSIWLWYGLGLGFNRNGFYILMKWGVVLESAIVTGAWRVHTYEYACACTRNY